MAFLRFRWRAIHPTSHFSLRVLGLEASFLISTWGDRLVSWRPELPSRRTWNIHVLRVITLTNGGSWPHIILSTSSQCVIFPAQLIFDISHFISHWGGNFITRLCFLSFSSVFVCNRFYGWLVMWIAAFSVMGTYLNFTHETCFSHKLGINPR